MIASVAGRYGQVAFLRHDEWHGRSFAAYAEWSESEVRLWRKVRAIGACAVDVGAHIGAHTLALASLVGPSGRVHAFEPQRLPHQLLCANIVANQLWQVEPWPIGLGSVPRTLWYDRPDYGQEGNFGAVELSTQRRAVAVDVRRLDDLGLGAIDFIKIDVEGMESDVLRGAAKTLRQHRPALYVENDRALSAHGLISTLQSFGYQAWWHLAPLFNPDNHASNRTNLFPGVVSLNMLALPLGQQPPEDPGLRPLDAVRFRPDGAVEYS
jgi:FkbM family methyltransferase